MVEALQSIKYEDKDPYELAEQAKNHGNSLFSFGKKNPAQYQNAITSYNVRQPHASAFYLLALVMLLTWCHHCLCSLVVTAGGRGVGEEGPR